MMSIAARSDEAGTNSARRAVSARQAFLSQVHVDGVGLSASRGRPGFSLLGLGLVAVVGCERPIGWSGWTL